MPKHLLILILHIFGENKLKLEHIALASNSEKESDVFFIELLGLEKIRTFTVSSEKMNRFFDINETHKFIRYEKHDLSVEVIITNKKATAKDQFTHSCILVEDSINLLKRAESMGYRTIMVPKDQGDG